MDKFWNLAQVKVGDEFFLALFVVLPSQQLRCIFQAGAFKAVIGRTMFETDRVNAEHVRRCKRMDFVWVPTDFHVNAFKASGVDPTKLRKIVQPVDLDFFNPHKVESLDLASIGSRLVLGFDKMNLKEHFVYLSVFKWEYRKGWDVLLRSYLQEFSADDNVVLYLLTNPYHSDKDFSNKIVQYVHKSELEKPGAGWATIYVIDEHIAQVDLPRLYKAADAFILPSRGEGNLLFSPTFSAKLLMFTNIFIIFLFLYCF